MEEPMDLTGPDHEENNNNMKNCPYCKLQFTSSNGYNESNKKKHITKCKNLVEKEGKPKKFSQKVTKYSQCFLHSKESITKAKAITKRACKSKVW